MFLADLSQPSVISETKATQSARQNICTDSDEAQFQRVHARATQAPPVSYLLGGCLAGPIRLAAESALIVT
jgi:hypothetical protein